jgi:hypothetical protein
MTTEICIERWAVVASPAGLYLGELGCAPPNTDVAVDGGAFVLLEPVAPTTVQNRMSIRWHVARGELVALYPVFAFSAQLVQTPQGVKRAVMVLPIDLCAHAVPVYVQASAIYFCAEMDAGDQKTYRALVQQGYDALAQTRADRAGIALASTLSKAAAPKT